MSINETNISKPINSALKIISIIINDSYGGWRLSQQAVDLYNQRTNQTHTSATLDNDFREDLILINIVKELGPLASGYYASLKVVDVVKDYYVIDEYDGLESVHFADILCGNMIDKIVIDNNSTDQEKIHILRMACQERRNASKIFNSFESNM